jgi:diacylglycerol kinase family enzyme
LISFLKLLFFFYVAALTSIAHQQTRRANGCYCQGNYFVTSVVGGTISQHPAKHQQWRKIKE